MGKDRSPFLTVTAVLFMFIVLIVSSAISLSADGPPVNGTKPQENPYAKAEITIQIIPSVNNTFGYDILLYNKPMIHQPNIPGLSGNEGFTTKEKAQTVAEFVVKKIRNNEMPPTVSIDDLNTLGALK